VTVEKLAISGAYVFGPRIHADARGHFLEWFRGDEFAGDIGHRLALAQANLSVSRTGTLRGIHFADVPPGQAKYVICARGEVLDVIVDIRTGSPTFGMAHAVGLDDQEHRAVYLAEGLGHAFMALTDQTTLVYLCSEPYAPIRERAIYPLDPQLAIPWPDAVEPLLSDKDAAAPTLAEAQSNGLLPAYEACLAYTDGLRNT
jgi:dTDP-4-dehydrorhamnose 3,5-epimerase